jgi:hypothetical protein
MGDGVAPVARQAVNLLFIRAANEERDPDGARDDDAAPEVTSSDALEEAGRREQEYVRRRLAEELGREPSEEELNEWLRRHTEGY